MFSYFTGRSNKWKLYFAIVFHILSLLIVSVPYDPVESCTEDTAIIEPRREKTGFLHICENKGADQLRGNREADQRLCFRYTDSTIPLLPQSEISSF